MSGFGHTKTVEGDLWMSSFVGLNAPGPRGSWTEGTPHFHSACYEGALSGIGGLAGEPSHTNNA
jgi:hypothetical protein